MTGLGKVRITSLLLVKPPAEPIITNTGPVRAPPGTVATICVSLQVWTFPDTALKVTTLLPRVAPGQTLGKRRQEAAVQL